MTRRADEWTASEVRFGRLVHISEPIAKVLGRLGGHTPDTIVVVLASVSAPASGQIA